MDVEATRVIDDLTSQIAHLSYELALARAQARTLAEQHEEDTQGEEPES